jgi:multiple antibiotic resistance protein
MNLDFREIITVAMVLFAVIDIVGSIPIIIDLRTKFGHVESGKASIVAGVIMITFLFVGEQILSLIGIDVNSFAVAGAFVLFFLALEMILGIRLYKDDEASSASIVPIAFPLIAGAEYYFGVFGSKSFQKNRNKAWQKWFECDSKNLWSYTTCYRC